MSFQKNAPRSELEYRRLFNNGVIVLYNVFIAVQNIITLQH